MLDWVFHFQLFPFPCVHSVHIPIRISISLNRIYTSERACVFVWTNFWLLYRGWHLVFGRFQFIRFTRFIRLHKVDQNEWHGRMTTIRQQNRVTRIGDRRARIVGNSTKKTVTINFPPQNVLKPVEFQQKSLSFTNEVLKHELFWVSIIIRKYIFVCLRVCVYLFEYSMLIGAMTGIES